MLNDSIHFVARKTIVERENMKALSKELGISASKKVYWKKTLEQMMKMKERMKRMVKEMIDEEILATKGHLRALIFNEEAQARRSSRDGVGMGDMEMVRLQQH